MEMLHTQRKDNLLNTLEWFHIHNLILQKKQSNDTFTDTNNPTFDIISKHTPHNKTALYTPTFHLLQSLLTTYPNPLLTLHL
jgi:hypothetical protein